MEKQSQNNSLELKLRLLKTLREGKVEESQAILEQLSHLNHSHPQLYQTFHSFISEHKEDIIQDHEEQIETKQEERVIIVDTDSEGSWITDRSIDWSEQDGGQKIKQNATKSKSKPTLLRNVINTKSAVHLKSVKQVKKHFHVQTKPKENMGSSTINLRRQSSPSSKLINPSYFSALDPTLTGPVSKLGAKRVTKPYFPPISTKQSLKLS